MLDNPKINLKFYRESKNISQVKLAKSLGITQGYISDIESGKKSPTLRMLCKISNALKVCPRMMISCTVDCEKCDKDVKCNCNCF